MAGSEIFTRRKLIITSILLIIGAGIFTFLGGTGPSHKEKAKSLEVYFNDHESGVEWNDKLYALADEHAEMQEPGNKDRIGSLNCNDLAANHGTFSDNTSSWELKIYAEDSSLWDDDHRGWPDYQKLRDGWILPHIDKVDENWDNPQYIGIDYRKYTQYYDGSGKNYREVNVVVYACVKTN